MDIFCEQIVKKKKTTTEWLMVLGLWLFGWLIAMLVIWFALLSTVYLPLAFLGAIGVIYGAMKLSAKFNVEYEYAVTNGLLDVDKIINRSDRKRLISVEINTFDTFQEVTNPINGNELKNYDKVVVAVADPAAEDKIYSATFRHPVKGRVMVVFQPSEKVLTTVQKSLPRNLQARRFG